MLQFPADWNRRKKEILVSWPNNRIEVLEKSALDLQKQSSAWKASQRISRFQKYPRCFAIVFRHCDQTKLYFRHAFDVFVEFTYKILERWCGDDKVVISTSKFSIVVVCRATSPPLPHCRSKNIKIYRLVSFTYTTLMSNYVVVSKSEGEDKSQTDFGSDLDNATRALFLTPQRETTTRCLPPPGVTLSALPPNFLYSCREKVYNIIGSIWNRTLKLESGNLKLERLTKKYRLPRAVLILLLYKLLPSLNIQCLHIMLLSVVGETILTIKWLFNLYIE